jgi:hypothetical protein
MVHAIAEPTRGLVAAVLLVSGLPRLPVLAK